MPTADTAVGYIIWGVDHDVYGPVELPALVAWIKDERVTADTWIFVERSECWEKSAHLPELRMFFQGTTPTQGPSETVIIDRSTGESNPAALRHIKLFAGLNDAQLDRFLQVMEVQNFSAGAQVVKQGQSADSMHVLLEGELRIRSIIEGREASLGNIGAGEYFGEMSLFDHGTRSADVFAVQDSTVLKIPASEFEKFTYESPDLAAPFLFALTRSMACRIRADNKRYRDSITHIHPAGR